MRRNKSVKTRVHARWVEQAGNSQVGPDWQVLPQAHSNWLSTPCKPRPLNSSKAGLTTEGTQRAVRYRCDIPPALSSFSNNPPPTRCPISRSARSVASRFILPICRRPANTRFTILPISCSASAHTSAAIFSQCLQLRLVFYLPDSTILTHTHPTRVNQRVFWEDSVLGRLLHPTCFQSTMRQH